MNHPPLDALLSPDLSQASFIASADGIRLFLQHRHEVQAVTQAMQSGAISEAVVGTFVTQLMADLKPGVHFAHDIPLAALAVACERHRTPYTILLIRRLASINIAEMWITPRVAKLVQCEWAKEESLN